MAFPSGNENHMRAGKAPVRKCILPAQGQPVILSSFPILKLFSISVKEKQSPGCGEEGLSSSQAGGPFGKAG